MLKILSAMAFTGEDVKSLLYSVIQQRMLYVDSTVLKKLFVDNFWWNVIYHMVVVGRSLHEVRLSYCILLVGE